MTSTILKLALKNKATTAAAEPNCGAVATAEHSAAFVSFQR
jgi:hypothetical protein